MVILSWNEIRSRAHQFVHDWKDGVLNAREEADAQTYQTDFLYIFGVSRRQVATFESRVRKGGQADLFGETSGGHRGYIDLFWKGHIMIEMKTPGKDLKKAYQQAKEYAKHLPPEDLPVCILICDFVTFEYYDLEKNDGPIVFTLKDLPQYVELFSDLAGYKDVPFAVVSPVDIEAAEHMGELHDALLQNGYSGHELEMYLVRLLFCLFADDTGIFGKKKLFFEYIRQRTNVDGSDLALHLGLIFDTLNKDVPARQINLDDQLKAFPYINGGLFGERLETAAFNSDMRRTLLKCCALDWGQIKPEIFGAMFQSVKDKEKRRALGEHYTSEPNILKLIKPLFLDNLRAEFEKIKVQTGGRKNSLLQFHDRLHNLKFLDPACGCGNFLVVSYRELRLLEIDVLKEILGVEQILDIELMIRVNVNQFYGIEIEEFPARIAQAALWLIDHLMNIKASEAFGKYIARIPLAASPSIVIGNALTINWETIVSPVELSFILGNPPFLGKKYQSSEQKTAMQRVLKDLPGGKSLDFVACWYLLAAKFIQKNSTVRAAFVSTNSITQGEQVGILWLPLFNRYKIVINFAHQTFKWSNKAKGVAAVYCVIIGFSQQESPVKRLFTYADVKGNATETTAKHINGYLSDSPDIWISNRTNPLSKVPEMVAGNKPVDYNHLKIEAADYPAFIEKDPLSKKYIKRMIGADEFINNLERYCLWLTNCPPEELRKMPEALKRVNACREARLKSVDIGAQKLAETPSVFRETMNPASYLVIPAVSSERRKYIPIGFYGSDTIPVMGILIIPGADLYHFGILTSTMHMAWMRYVCGRLESRYRYSKEIVYNNFPWPSATEKQRTTIEQAAQGVLDVRSSFPNSNLAALYDPNTMPPALVKAHQKLDKMVEAAYGKIFTNEADRVAHLFYLYQTLTEGLMAKKAKRTNI